MYRYVCQVEVGFEALDELVFMAPFGLIGFLPYLHCKLNYFYAVKEDIVIQTSTLSNINRDQL